MVRESKILLIDDDSWNISIGTILVKRAIGLDYLHTFTEPHECLKYLSSKVAQNLKIAVDNRLARHQLTLMRQKI